MENEREILVDPTKDGLFTIPGKDFSSDDEVRWGKRRMDSVRVSQYSDPYCGLPNCYDKTGAYLCAGTKDGMSSPCNKREGNECLIRKGSLTNPNFQSCAFWEVKNAGDMEGRYSPDGRLDDERIGFGETKNKEGFGCRNCEYYRPMPKADSEGRKGWCALKGHTVLDTACCWDNDPIDEYKTDVSKERRNAANMSLAELKDKLSKQENKR